MIVVVFYNIQITLPPNNSFIMRILKYLFLYFFYSVVLHYQFCCYSKGAYYIESKIINSPAAAVYNYVNDYRNWEDFGTWSKMRK
jgi:hypothetical protein